MSGPEKKSSKASNNKSKQTKRQWNEWMNAKICQYIRELSN